MLKRTFGILVCLGAGFAYAQKADDELTARQIFDLGAKAPAAVPARRAPSAAPRPAPTVKTQPAETPVPDKPVADKPVVARTPDRTPVETVAYAPLALKYSILERKGEQFVEVDPDTEFRSGDRIRVRVEANGPAFLYIVLGGSSGQWRVLFPSKQINAGDNRIDKARAYTIPPENDPPFLFDDTAGVEKVSLVLSRSPEPDLEKLIYVAGDPTRNGREKVMMARADSISDNVVGGMREKMLSRDLVFEKYEGPAPDGKSEKAVYAATRDKSSGARLFVDLKLIHK